MRRQCVTHYSFAFMPARKKPCPMLGEARADICAKPVLGKQTIANPELHCASDGVVVRQQAGRFTLHWYC
jgi:hypothetical protein